MDHSWGIKNKLKHNSNMQQYLEEPINTTATEGIWSLQKYKAEGH